MNLTSFHILPALGLASLWLLVAGTFLLGILKLTKCRSPRLRQIAWSIVLVQGVLWIPASWRYTIAEVSPSTMKSWNNDELAADAWTKPRSSEPIKEDATLVVVPQNSLSNSSVYQAKPNPSVKQPWQPFTWAACVGTMLSVWLAGMLIIIGKRTRDYILFIRHNDLKRNDTPEWNDELLELCHQLGIDQPISLYCSDEVGPAFCRWPNEYRIVVPLSLWQRLSKPERNAILRHELGHYQRGDLYWSFTMQWLALPQWFNPMSWFALRQIENNMELACDDLVCRSGDEMDIATYAKALLNIGQCSSQRSVGVAAIDGACLADRIRRILDSSNATESPLKRLLVVMMLAILCLTNLCRVKLSAQQPDNFQAPAKSRATADEIVSDKDFNDAVLDLRSMGGFVRLFHPRDSKDHWIQIILEGDAQKAGFHFEKPASAPKNPRFDDDTMEMVRILCLSSKAHVHLRNCQFTSEGMEQLAGTKVERLELTGANIEDQHLATLPKLIEMRELSIDDSSITDKGLNALAECTQLESLDLGKHPQIQSPTSALLARLPKLKGISLDLTQDDVEHLNQGKQLKSLNIQLNTPEGVAAFRELETLGQLHELTLGGPLISSEVIVFVSRQSPNLETWYLRDCKDINAEAATAISSLLGLKVLSLSGTNITDEQLKRILPLPKLEWLDLSRTSISDESMHAIGQQTKLRFLSLHQTSVSEAELDQLTELRELFGLDLRGTYVKSLPKWLQTRDKLKVEVDADQFNKPTQKEAAQEKSSLEKGVDEFNKKAGKDPIGKFEPPLSASEVVAAIRAWDRQKIPVDDETFSLFEEIVRTGQLPLGSTIDSTTNWSTGEFNYQVWWIDLNLRTGPNRGYTYRIRARTLSSQTNK